MLLGFGPVLRYEMTTTARRGRYYVARVVYVLTLLALLATQFANWEGQHPRGATPEQVHRFAESAFIDFAGTQGVALLLLIPALVAGVIADEHQRNTLHYLLASRLTSVEIVLGKLSARLVHVGVFVALGLPVVSLLSLFGGINPEYLVFVYCGTATMVLFVAGFSVLISVMAPRPREAILAAYVLEAIWLLGPIAVSPFADALDGPLFWVAPAARCALLSNPLPAWWEFTEVSMIIWRTGVWWNSIFGGPLEATFYWMVGTQASGAIAFLILAICGLRPLRGASWPGGKPRTGWATRLSSLARACAGSPAASPILQNKILTAPRRRPACTDDPMLWKERYVAMGRGLKWLGSPLAVLFVGVLLGCYLFDSASPVVAGVLKGRVNDGSRLAMSDAICFASVVLGLLAMLAIATAAAVSMTSEREYSTWDSIATTLLTPFDIIRAKQLGALWKGRWTALPLLIFWATGMLLGASNLLGLLVASSLLVTAAWFVAALGVFISLGARNTTRALLATLIVIFVAGWTWPSSLWSSLDSSYGVALMGRLNRARPAAGPYLTGCATLAAAYAAGAATLTMWSFRRLRNRWSRA
jgi:ABC-type transport system involved in multi-copper enzyme maturation permease subunit